MQRHAVTVGANASNARRGRRSLSASLRGFVAALLTLGMIGGFLAVLAAPATTAGAATTEPFSLSTASNAGQSFITWQGSKNKWADPTTLHGQIDPTTGAISQATLKIPPVTQPPQQGETPTFTFKELNPGTATGTYDATTGAVTLKDTLRLLFNIEPLGFTCGSSPIDVALSGTYNSSTQNVTLATTSSFTIPQFPDKASLPTCSGGLSSAVLAGINANPGGVAGSTGNAMSFAFNGQFKAGKPSATSLAASPTSPQLQGTKVTLTATVSDPSSSGTPTGTVNFLDNGATVGEGTLSSGKATLTTSNLPAGANQQLTAQYPGDPNYAPSTSSAVPYTVTPTPTIAANLPPSLEVPTATQGPTVTGVSPNAGPSAGGTSVTITGSGYTTTASVDFGSTPATSVDVKSASTITATSPKGSGTVDVTVHTSAGTSATSASDLFAYAAPTVTKVSPNEGPTNSVVIVTVSGTNFVPGATVNFGSTPGSNVSVDGPTSLTVRSPKVSSAATVNVTVTTPAGTSATSSADHFTFTASNAPVITRLYSYAGRASGGQYDYLYGHGFTGATAVHFGSTAAPSFRQSSDTYMQVKTPPGTAGTTVPVTVTTPKGTSAVTADAQFTYGLPTVTALSPKEGTAAGGTEVTITGTGFGGSTSSRPSVYFGSHHVPNSDVTWNSLTSMTAIAPPGSGTVDVRVRTGGGESATSPADQFTYGPTVSGVSPPSGPTAGGTSVTITGNSFVGGATVKFGATAATGVTVNSPTSITATAPSGIAGVVDVTVTTPVGTSPTTTADQFFYGPPTLTFVAPAAGPLAGGTTVTIEGSGFLGATAVDFNSTAATSFHVVSSTQLTAVTPPGSGNAFVYVTTNGGTSSRSYRARFRYDNAPSVDSLSPKSGPAGTAVTISGANFSAPAKVFFGATAATGVTVNSPTSITATAPGGTGSVDVTVSTSDGTSAVGPGDVYSYGAPTVTDISPSGGSVLGGTSVVITGEGFLTGATVEFGSTPATSVTVNSQTSITAVSPPGSVGAVDVRVRGAGGTSSTSPADSFTYSSGGQPGQATFTVTNPSTGQAWSNLYVELKVSGISRQPSSNITVSYQDQSGNWCPLTATGSETTFTYYFSGLGTSCGSPPGSFSLAPGASLNVPLEISYASATYLGPQTFDATLYSGSCSSPTSCSQSGDLTGSISGSSTIVLTPPARLGSQISFRSNRTQSSVRQTFLESVGGLRVQSLGAGPSPTGTVSIAVDGKPVTVTSDGVTPITNPTINSRGYFYGYFDTKGLSVGTHTLTATYSGDGVYNPASTSMTLTVLPAPTGTLYACTGSDLLGSKAIGVGYVTAKSAPVAPTLSGKSVWMTSGSVTLDLDPQVENVSFFEPYPKVSYVTNSIGITPSGTLTPSQSTLNKGSTDSIITFLGMDGKISVTGDPGSTLKVGVNKINSVWYAFGNPNQLSCQPAADPATMASIAVAGNALAARPKGQAAPGSQVTLTDTVYPAPPSGSSGYGSVTFYDGSNRLGTVPVDTSAGTATLSTNQLSAGKHQLSAKWSGTQQVPANTSKALDYFIGDPTTTTLSSSATSPSNAANPVTFTATVTPPKGNSTMPTGTVDFTQDGKPVKDCTGVKLGSDSPPTATCKLSFGPGESHKIVASYSGDDKYQTSSSDPLTQATLPGVQVAMASSHNPAIGGPEAQNVLLWAVVTPTSGSTTPTGTMDFLARGNPRCKNVPVVASGSSAWAMCIARFTDPSITANLTTVYSGDSNYSGATSPTYHQHTLPGTATKLYSSPNPSSGGQKVTLTAEVRPASGSVMPRGFVAFIVDKQIYMPCLFVPLGGGGRARCTLTLPAGTHYAHADYLGGSGYSSSESNVVTQKVTASARHRRR